MEVEAKGKDSVVYGVLYYNVLYFIKAPCVLDHNIFPINYKLNQ